MERLRMMILGRRVRHGAEVLANGTLVCVCGRVFIERADETAVSQYAMHVEVA